MSNLLAALDLGTTSVRVLVFEPDGGVVAESRAPLETSFPRPGWVEQDPTSMWQIAEHALDAAVGPHAGSVAALGLTTQRSTVITWDAITGSPLSPAIGWQDDRTAARTAELAAMGVPASTQASATKLEWLLREDAAVADAAASGRLRVGTPDAWLAARFGAAATDPTNASTTLLYDITTGDWHDGLLGLFGIERDWLPAVVPTAATHGEARVRGHSIPIAARAGDQQAASFGVGITAEGQAKLTLGTSAMLDVNTGTTVAAPAGTYPLALWQLGDGPIQCCTEGSVHAAGATIDWLRDVGVIADVAQLDDLAGRAQGDEVTFVPALQGLGAPWADDRARGRLSGLTRGTGAAEIAAAAIDGIAHSCADLAEAMQLGDNTALRVDGGLARSRRLLQRLADLTGRRIERSHQIEATALGAALLAGYAVGVFDSPADATAAAAFEVAIEPEADHREDRARWREAVVRSLARHVGEEEGR